MSIKKKHNEKVILIPDGEHPFLMRVAYCFSKYKHIKLHVMSNTKHFPMRYSRHIHQITYVNKTNKVDWLNDINRIVKSHDIDLIMPVNDDGIKTLITHLDLLESKEKLVKLSNINNYNKAIDKSELAKHLLKHNISHPKTIIYNTNDNSLDFEPVGFPIIVKPAFGFGGEGIHILNNKLEFITFKAKKKKINIYVMQEFIEGYDVDCSVLCDEGEIVAHTIQKGILYENREFAPAIGLHFLKNKDLLDTVKILMRSLKWSGIAHIDLRYDSKSKDFKVIEINGRFWSSLDASLAAGINFPYLYSLGMQKVNKSKNEYKNIDYLNLKGLLKTIISKPVILFNFSFIKHNTPVLFTLKDPLPTLIMYLNKLKGVFRRRLKLN